MGKEPAKSIAPYVQVESKDGHYRFVHVRSEVVCFFRWHGRSTWRTVPAHELSAKLQNIAAAMRTGVNHHKAYAPWRLPRKNDDIHSGEHLRKSRCYKVRPRKAAMPAQSRAA